VSHLNIVRIVVALGLGLHGLSRRWTPYLFDLVSLSLCILLVFHLQEDARVKIIYFFVIFCRISRHLILRNLVWFFCTLVTSAQPFEYRSILLPDFIFLKHLVLVHTQPLVSLLFRISSLVPVFTRNVYYRTSMRIFTFFCFLGCLRKEGRVRKWTLVFLKGNLCLWI